MITPFAILFTVEPKSLTGQHAVGWDYGKHTKHKRKSRTTKVLQPVAHATR